MEQQLCPVVGHIGLLDHLVSGNIEEGLVGHSLHTYYLVPGIRHCLTPWLWLLKLHNLCLEGLLLE